MLYKSVLCGRAYAHVCKMCMRIGMFAFAYFTMHVWQFKAQPTYWLLKVNKHFMHENFELILSYFIGYL